MSKAMVSVTTKKLPLDDKGGYGYERYKDMTDIRLDI